MAKKISLAVLLSASVLLLSGCASGNGGILGILNGFLAWSRQDWDLSVASFIGTAGEAASMEDVELREYAVFGLASTYLAQEEYESALQRLSELEDSENTGIRAGVWYQAGVIAYRKSEFDRAASFFRKSLENDPSAFDAKINLELSRRSLEERQSSRAGGASGISEEKTPGKDSETIFNLVRKKEQDRWKNQEEISPGTATADY